MEAVKTLSKVFLLTLLLAVFVKCGKNTDEACEVLRNKGVANKAMLTETWKFKSFDKIGGLWSKEKPPVDTMTLTFRSDSSFEGKGPCNNIKGTFYTQAKNTIIATDTGTTSVQCSGDMGEWEARYFKAIRSMQCYTIEDGDQLEIFFEEGDKNIMRFRKR